MCSLENMPCLNCKRLKWLEYDCGYWVHCKVHNGIGKPIHEIVYCSKYKPKRKKLNQDTIVF